MPCLLFLYIFTAYTYHMKKLLLFVLAIGCVVTLFSSCEKDATNLPKVSSQPLSGSTGSGNGNGGGGSSSGGGSTSSAEYQPFTKGSYWKQASSIFLVDTVINTLTGNTALFNNIRYYEVNQQFQKSGVFKGYYGYADHTYSMRAATVMYGIVITMPYYKDDVAIGLTWTGTVTDNGQVNGVPSRFIGKTTEKGISRVVKGKTYSNVVHTVLDMQYDLGSGFETVITYHFYLAKGIGIIETNSFTGDKQASNAILLEYSVK